MSGACFSLNVIAFIKCRYIYLDFISNFTVSDTAKPLKPITFRQNFARALLGFILKSENTKTTPIIGKPMKSIRVGSALPAYRNRNVPLQIHLPAKENKSIVILTVPKADSPHSHQKNVGITLDEHLIFNLLSEKYQHVQISEIATKSDLRRVVDRRPDLVFSGVKYFDFGDGKTWLNDFLDQCGIAYMASNRKALEREANKSHAKDIVQKAGVQTARYFKSVPGQHLTETSIPIAFPLFIKPVIGGDSRGVDAFSYVHDFASCKAKVSKIYSKQNNTTLAEAYLTGREFTVGVFQDCKTHNCTTMPVEIIASKNKNGHRILDFHIKKNDTEQVVAVASAVLLKQLSTMAEAAFKALGGKSFGRIDIKMGGHNVLHFIEANLMPGLGQGYFFRSCLLNLNMSYDQMILRIAANGLGVSADAAVS